MFQVIGIAAANGGGARRNAHRARRQTTAPCSVAAALLKRVDTIHRHSLRWRGSGKNMAHQNAVAP